MWLPILHGSGSQERQKENIPLLASFSVLIKSAGATEDIMRTVFVLLVETPEDRAFPRPKARGDRRELVAKAWADREKRAAVRSIRTDFIFVNDAM